MADMAMLSTDPGGVMPSGAEGPMPPAFEDFVASKIQATFRGHVVRQQQHRRTHAAVYIQTSWRRYQVTSALPVPVSTLQAAVRIQRGWRRHAGKKIYRFFRDMIYFRERGDPAQLLRAINPREAAMLDAASGTHVRFRLGGCTFPPVIYYKIFTHRPVTDMCAFSPKDYTAQVNLAPKNMHSHAIPGVAEWVHRQNHAGWYQRVDNNGWRPLAQHVLVDVDPITALTAARRRDYHHVPLVRQQEAALKRKQRQRDWMTKMYAVGKSGGAGDGGRAGAEEERELADDEGMSADDRELLRWSSALDFNAYTEDWSTLATSQWSEDNIPLPPDYFDEKYDDAELLPVIPIDGMRPVYSTLHSTAPLHTRPNPLAAA